MYTISSVLTLTCMNDMTDSKELIGERILCNAVIDIIFHKYDAIQKIEQLINRSKDKN
jgi:hypothetical protein